jgi:tRNA nucleotidyltransferase (CCA-adding enzyme)
MMTTYLVGGAVRDRLMNYPFHERDWVVTGSSPEEMIEQGFAPVGKDFPVFIHPQTGEEYALARTERKTGKGYAGFAFHTDKSVTLEQDLLRRDLTINAMAEDSDGNIIDPYGGQEDLKKRLLHHVSPSFAEDPVRILRVARFAARYHHLGFRIADDTMQLMKEMVANGEADHLVAERVWKEWQRAMTEASPSQFILALQQCGALTAVAPEFAQRLHKDHGPLQRLELNHHPEDADINTALLLCDLEPDSIEQSLKQAQQLCQRMATPKAPRELTEKLCQYHGQILSNELPSAEQLLSLLQSLDSFRRPLLLEKFLSACKTIAEERHCHHHTELLHQAFNQSVKVTAQQVMSLGAHGKAVGEAMTKARIKEIQTLLDTAR